MTRSAETVSLQLPVSFGPARRHEIAGRSVRVEALVHFNALLRTIWHAAPRVDSDALVSLARKLQAGPAGQTVEIVGERIGRVQVLRRMLRDAEWPVSPELRVRARLLLAYVDKHEDLIPDGTELFGHLDDALMIELSWPRFQAEVEAYRDFCEHRRNGRVGDAYAAWRDSREDVLRWEQHRAEMRSRSYAPSRSVGTGYLRVT